MEQVIRCKSLPYFSLSKFSVTITVVVLILAVEKISYIIIPCHRSKNAGGYEMLTLLLEDAFVFVKIKARIRVESVI